MTPTEPTPCFDETAGQHRDYLLRILSTPVPTAAQIIAAAEEGRDD